MSGLRLYLYTIATSLYIARRFPTCMGGVAAGGAGLVAADIADSLRLAGIKLKAGDRSFVLESLAGQSVILAQMMAEAPRDYSESEA